MTNYVTALFLIGILIWPVAFILALIIKLTKIPKMYKEIIENQDQLWACIREEEFPETNDVEEIECEDDIEELPFCQLFRIGTEMCLLIDHVEMCPDETAFIRVVDDEGYTPLYKRKVKRSRRNERFIKFNGANYYLDDKKTQPTITKK